MTLSYRERIYMHLCLLYYDIYLQFHFLLLMQTDYLLTMYVYGYNTLNELLLSRWEVNIFKLFAGVRIDLKFSWILTLFADNLNYFGV